MQEKIEICGCFFIIKWSEVIWKARWCESPLPEILAPSLSRQYWFWWTNGLIQYTAISWDQSLPKTTDGFRDMWMEGIHGISLLHFPPWKAASQDAVQVAEDWGGNRLSCVCSYTIVSAKWARVCAVLGVDSVPSTIHICCSKGSLTLASGGGTRGS